MQKKEVVQYILAKCHNGRGKVVNQSGAYGFAPANLALCKYWGKRDEELNLPVTSSLSISLGSRGTFTSVSHINGSAEDIYVVNGKEINAQTEFAKRLRNFLDLFRPDAQTFYTIETENTVPLSAGLASSASGYAALTQALNKFYNWNLSQQELSILARLGSGSACRSLWHGFVEWQRGEATDGMDSYAVSLPYIWPELRIGALIISTQAKEISSREAMRRTVATSALYQMWSPQAESDMHSLHQALQTKDFSLLGSVAEHNALMMHALMQSARPPIIYTRPETLAAMHRVWELRRAGVEVFFTQDAGANLQLLFLAAEESAVVRAFPGLEIIQPFADLHAEQVVLVDENDRELGSGEKLPVHIQGQLHRAFSVIIWRRHNGKIELLLQQRSQQKYHSAGLWSNTCCGHPRPGEDLRMAAKRRLHEEMGIVASLKEVGVFYYKALLPASNLYENEIDHVFVGELSCDATIQPNEEEVQAYCWIDREKLLVDLNANPDQYTVWLPQVINAFQV